MDSYRTEEEQVEMLRRWWADNGRSTIAAIIIAISLSFGFQTWKDYNQRQMEAASDVYMTLLQSLNNAGKDADATQVNSAVKELADRLKSDYGSTSYARFAALQLAQLSVNGGDLAAAEAELRWVLGEVSADSTMAQVTQLRLARVVAAGGDTDQALSILAAGASGPFKAAYAVAHGDVLLAAGRADEARQAYLRAWSLASAEQAQVDLATLQQKLQSLNPAPVTASTESAPAAASDAAVDGVEFGQPDAAEHTGKES